MQKNFLGFQLVLRHFSSPSCFILLYFFPGNCEIYGVLSVSAAYKYGTKWFLYRLAMLILHCYLLIHQLWDSNFEKTFFATNVFLFNVSVNGKRITIWNIAIMASRCCKNYGFFTIKKSQKWHTLPITSWIIVPFGYLNWKKQDRESKRKTCKRGDMLFRMGGTKNWLTLILL